MFPDFESAVKFFELVGRGLVLCERDELFQVSEYPILHQSLSFEQFATIKKFEELEYLGRNQARNDTRYVISILLKRKFDLESFREANGSFISFHWLFMNLSELKILIINFLKQLDVLLYVN